MGNLAMWAGIGGAAKGGEKYLTMRQEQDDRKEMADIDTARQKMLARIRGEESRKTARVTGEENRKGIEKSGEVQAGTVIPSETKSKLEIQKAGAEDSLEQIGARGEEERQTLAVGESSRAGREADRRVWQSSENDLDRKLKRELADMEAKLAKSSGKAGQEMLKRQLDRYEAQKVKDTHFSGSVPVGESETPAIFDKLTGTWYVAKGDRLYYPDDLKEGSESTAGKPPPNPKHIAGLYAKPAMASDFYGKFGYLPKGYLQALMKHDLGLVNAAPEDE